MSRETLQTVAQSLVYISCIDSENMGSGVVIGKRNDGKFLILTCEHVISNSKKISVIMRRSTPRGESKPKCRAVIEASDPSMDLALLSIKPRSDIPILHLTDEEPDRYEEIYIGGHPNAEEWVCGRGEYQGISEARPSLYRFLGPVFGGSSGGAMVDIQGRLAGLVVSQSFDGPVRMQNLGFAIPSSAIEKFLKATGGKAQ